MERYKLERVVTMIKIENIGNRIYIFGRDNVTKKPYIEMDNNFFPYFYIEYEYGKFISIDGKRLKKVICNKPFEIPELREQYDNTYEADIVYTNRYIIDSYYNKPIEEEPLRILYLDIETEIKGDLDVEKADNKILSITVYDNFLKTYYCLAICNLEEDMNTDNIKYKFFDNEKDLLNSFLNLFEKLNPDIVTAYFGDHFDFPYLLKRLQKNDLDINRLSRIKQTTFKDNHINLFGRVLLDLYYCYKKFAQGERESNSLDYISKYEIGEGKEKYEGSLKDLYKTNIKKFLAYNIKDVELMVKLNEKLRLIETFDVIRRVSKCQFNDVFGTVKPHDCLMLSVAKKRGVILPTWKEHEKEKYKGGFVLKSIAGLHKNVAVFDLKSLYPNIMITFNISPDTITNETSNVISLDGKYNFRKDKGLVVEILQKLLKLRTKKKQEMKKYDEESIEYKSLDNIQYGIKVIANSLYGVLGNRFFRMYNKDVADAVTYAGRRIIKYSINKIEQAGYKVIYGDTDSIFFLIGNSDINTLKKLCNSLTESYKEFVKQFNCDKCLIEMEFEKVYKSIFFKQETKKRYAGIIKWLEGKEVNKLDIKGFESRRSDTPTFIRVFLKELFFLILNGCSENDIYMFINNIVEKYKTLKEEACNPITITKPLKEYKQKTPPPQIRGALHSNIYYNEDINAGDKVKWCYVKKCPDNVLFTNVITFKEKLPEGYVIDYDKMVERNILNKVEPILETVNLTIKKICNKNKSLFDF